MTKYGNAKFSVGANSRESHKKYADNYDAIFGGKVEDDPIREAWRHVEKAYAKAASARFGQPQELADAAQDLLETVEALVSVTRG